MTASPLDRAAEIAAWFAAAGLGELELSGPGGRLRLRRGELGAAPGPIAPDDTSAAQAAGPGREVVASPGVGVFLRAHPLRDQPLAAPGERVAEGQALGLLRIGSLLVPVLAPRPGTVRAIPAEDGALVGFGDPLFELAHPG